MNTKPKSTQEKPGGAYVDVIHSQLLQEDINDPGEHYNKSVRVIFSPISPIYGAKTTESTKDVL